MAEKQRASFGEWYAQNREDFNARRRQRYRDDKKYRQKALKQAKLYREKNPDRYASRRKERTAYSAGEAALALNIAIQTLRNYEQKGYVPASKTGLQHRRYTPRQVELLEPLVAYLKEHNYHEITYKKRVAAIVTKIHKSWEG